MIQFETTQATILFVEVPEEAMIFNLIKDHLWYCLPGDHCDDYENSDEFIILPEGTWQFITLLKDAKEEQAQSICHSDAHGIKWIDYVMDMDQSIAEHYGPYVFDTALESIHSLATSLGVKGNAAVLVKVSV